MLSVKLKNYINIIFLVLSCAMSIYFLSQITDNIMVKVIIVIFVIVYEVTMQYVLSLGRAKLRKGGWAIFTAMLYFFFYATYVFIYAIPSALGFFVAEASVQKASAAVVTMEKGALEELLTDNRQTILALNRQLEFEAETGYGSRSRAIMEQLNKLRDEQKELQAELFKVPEKKVKKVQRNSFGSLAEVLSSFIDMTEDLLKLIVFSTTILMLYLGLILTSWDIEIEDGRENRDSREDGKKGSGGERRKRGAGKKKEKEGAGEETKKESLEESLKQSSFKSFVRKVLEKSSFKSSNELERFIDASIRDTGILNSARRVNMLTGIPIDRCNEYRKRLDEMKIEGTPVVETVQGGSRANFEKEEILEAARKEDKERGREAG